MTYKLHILAMTLTMVYIACLEDEWSKFFYAILLSLEGMFIVHTSVQLPTIFDGNYTVA